jgi:hypothetical protein
MPTSGGGRSLGESAPGETPTACPKLSIRITSPGWGGACSSWAAAAAASRKSAAHGAKGNRLMALPFGRSSASGEF